MFRFNNPDALLVLLLVAARVRGDARDRDGRHALAACSPASLVGFGFLTKMLQAFLVLPAFALAYLVAAPPRWAGGSCSVLAGGRAVVVSRRLVGRARRAVAGAARGPYIGGSQNNSVLELILGYNGLGRLTGDETGSVGGGGAGGGRRRSAATTGLDAAVQRRDAAAQIAWLLPAALIAAGRRPVVTRAAPRTDRDARRARSCGAAGCSSPGLVFSFMSGIIHPYYTVALAPAIAALVGDRRSRLLWRRRGHAPAGRVLAVAAVAA